MRYSGIEGVDPRVIDLLREVKDTITANQCTNSQTAETIFFFLRPSPAFCKAISKFACLTGLQEEEDDKTFKWDKRDRALLLTSFVFSGLLQKDLFKEK